MQRKDANKSRLAHQKTKQTSIVEVFADLTIWMGIKRVIDRINANATAA